MRAITSVLILAFSVAAWSPGYADAAAASATSGEPSNRWRYEFYAGRWWYWKPGAQWSYFDGRRWVDWGHETVPMATDSRRVAGDSSAQKGRGAPGYRTLGVYPFNYSGGNVPNNGLPSTSGPVGTLPGAASGFGLPTISGGSTGVGLETGSRSGDANSGVGGGAVGGADVSGWNQRK